ncbi:pentapeptide repeat-containing protein, partial [Litoreibacter halocynthiae]|uniref:pentapeptide repeat-containing protein n=1 Tax=Litoreibacter halocynthiae TaxID=1242689 RepID=UPI0024938ABA
GADFWRANLEEADLTGVSFDADTSLTAAYVRGAAIKDVDHIRVAWEQSQIDVMFGDASVILSATLTRPAHWPVWEMLPWVFKDEWHKWKADPASYIPPEKPS